VGRGCWNTVHGAHESTQGLELVIAKDGLNSGVDNEDAKLPTQGTSAVYDAEVPYAQLVGYKE